VIAVSPQQDAMARCPWQKSQPRRGSPCVLAQKGVTSGYPVRTSIGGLPAVTAGFAAATDNGTLRGTVLLVRVRGAVYRLVRLCH